MGPRTACTSRDKFSSVVLAAAAAAMSCALSPAARGDWRTYLMNGTEFDTTTATALDGDVLFGQGHRIVPPIGYNTVRWQGTNPNGMLFTSGAGEENSVLGARQGQYVGLTNAGAALWIGGPENRRDLQPAGAYASSAVAVWADQQAGYTITQNIDSHAALWRGSAESWVDLHPAGARNSGASATDGTLQGGYFQLLGGGPEAALWNGTAQSMVSLNPVGYSMSAVMGMVPGQQAGWAERQLQGDHAGIWHGTAASFIDLNPAGYPASEILATVGWAQVGWVNAGGFDQRAGVWFGTAASFEQLPTPAGYVSPEATCVSDVDGLLYIGGDAMNLSTGQTEALLWVGVPAPGSLAVGAVAGLWMVRASRRRRA